MKIFSLPSGNTNLRRGGFSSVLDQRLSCSTVRQAADVVDGTARMLIVAVVVLLVLVMMVMVVVAVTAVATAVAAAADVVAAAGVELMLLSGWMLRHVHHV